MVCGESQGNVPAMPYFCFSFGISVVIIQSYVINMYVGSDLKAQTVHTLPCVCHTLFLLLSINVEKII